MDPKYQDFLRLVIYQVYPRSFQDTNGDGIGDLRGVTQRLDYLKELGVNAIWFSPCFKSPNDDNGYDVADYCDIMDEFGTMEDMKELIAQMHARDMKVILDLVPNHTSTAHKWFQESRKGKDNPYSDFYYWYDEPVNDWKSSFRGSAWEYDEMRGQYYLHSYAISQADLNWNNPAVVKAMQDVVDFWVDMGADGFRIDVIDQISKDLDGSIYPGGRNCFGPRLHEFIQALFGREKTKHLFTVGECWAEDIDEINRHCAPERNELSTLFQFNHVKVGRKDKFTRDPQSMRVVRDILIRWQEQTAQYGLLHSLFTDNHDNIEFISRMMNDQDKRYESATCAAAMFYLLKGVPFIYQGQEFGTTVAHYDTIEQFDDIESKNAYKEFIQTMSAEEAIEKINFGSRDNARHPMAWNSQPGGGFSTSDKPWIPYHSRQKEVNLENDLASERSIFRFYQALLKLRAQTPAMLDGDFEVVSKPEDEFFIYTRTLDGERWVVICNFAQEQAIALPFACDTPLLANLNRETADGSYQPYECAVCKVKG